MINNETVLFEDSGLTLKPGTVVGYRANGMPIYNVAGGASDVVITGDDGDEDDETEDDTEDEGTSTEEWVPPTRDVWEKTVAAKQKADSEAAARKRFLRDAGFDPKTGEKVTKPSVQLEDDDSTDTSKSDADKAPGFDREKFEAQFQRQLDREVTKAERGGRASAYSLIHEVPSALEEAGWNGKNLPRMIKLLDLDALEIDQDGIDSDQLKSHVDDLKKDFPEFFKRQRMKDVAKDLPDTSAVGGGKKQAPASEEELDWKARMKMQLTRPGN